MSMWLTAKLIAPHLAIVRGPRVGAMLVEVTGKPPRWSRSMRGWACQERTCGEVVALAESRGYRVEIQDERQARLVDLSPAPADSRSDPAAFEPQLELGLG